MKNNIKKILLGLLLVLVIIQFVQPEKNSGVYNEKTDFLAMNNAPADIAEIVKTACYDCHSNNTNYPWYNNVAPVSYWINHHIEEGKEHMNFSDWDSYPQKKAAHKLDEFFEEVEEGEMPLKAYTIINGEAKLTSENKEKLLPWVKILN